MATIQVILLNGTTADADEVMADFYEIYDNIDNSNIAAGANIVVSKLKLTHNKIIIGNSSNVGAEVTPSGDLTISDTGVVTLSNNGSAPPRGSIIPFYDFDGDLTFNTDNWKYCNGQTYDFGGSVGVQTLPDLSGRYLVGFGTVAGGDIGTATWATAAIGANSINLQHSHDSHTHSVPAHYHGLGTIANSSSGSHTHVWRCGTGVGSDDFPGINPVPQSTNASIVDFSLSVLASSDSNHTHTFTGLVGATGSGINGDSAMTSGAGSTDNKLSATQDIRPSSIRIRFIMRVA